MPIYTKTGDRGQTSLLGGKRVSKADLRVEAYGTIDELNSVIGVAIAHLLTEKALLREPLEQIQADMLEIGSALASPALQKIPLLEARVKQFEQMIDEFSLALPPLTHFILPGGSVATASLHHARTVCRRAERTLVRLKISEKIDSNILIYLNRLSDLLFTMARFANLMTGEREVLWEKKS